MANGTTGTKSGSSNAAANNEAPVNNLAPHGEYDTKLLGQLYPHANSTEEAMAQWLKDYTDIDPAQAMDTAVAIKKFTGSWSHEIRDSQKLGLNDQAGQFGGSLEDYIGKAPQWDNSHDLHRGVKLSPATVDGILKGIASGENFDINNGGSASWSTKYSVSEDFAAVYSNNQVPVIFRTKKMKNATSIEHLTSIHGEHEVLSSKKNMFKPVKARKKNIYGKQGWLIDVVQV